jgi:hypothetical protein
MACGRVGSRKSKGEGQHRGAARSASCLHFSHSEGLLASWANLVDLTSLIYTIQIYPGLSLLRQQVLPDFPTFANPLINEPTVFLRLCTIYLKEGKVALHFLGEGAHS